MVSRLWLYFIVCAACTGCTGDSESQAQLAAIAEDLQSLRVELAQMRGDMALVRDSVAEMHKTTRVDNVALPPVMPARGADIDISADHPLLGNAAATVAVIEFSDFQCPFCKRYSDQTFPRLKNEYIDTGKIQYSARDLPLAIHQQAERAAIAAACASDQGLYWQMREVIFANNRSLSDETYMNAATELGVDQNAFRQCMAGTDKRLVIAADVRQASVRGITGTPTFLVGRIVDGRVVDTRRIVGAQSFSSFSAVIESLL